MILNGDLCFLWHLILYYFWFQDPTEIYNKAKASVKQSVKLVKSVISLNLLKRLIKIGEATKNVKKFHKKDSEKVQKFVVVNQ